MQTKPHTARVPHHAASVEAPPASARPGAAASPKAIVSAAAPLSLASASFGSALSKLARGEGIDTRFEDER